MTSTRKLLPLSLCLSLLVLVSCKQDPYPEGGEIRGTPTLTQEPLPELSMSVDDVIEFTEGRSRDYIVRATVKEPGKPIVSVDNLPVGATFDPETMVLSWTPGYFDGNDSEDPSIKSQIYPIKIWLRSSEDTVRALRKTVNLVVYDVQRAIDIKPAHTQSVNEGETYTNTFTIDNADFPNGPFKVVLDSMPPNMELTKIDERTYKLEFTPDHYHVNRKNSASVDYTGKIIVSNPANHIQSKDLKISVKDVRLDSKLVAPEVLTQGLDVSFQVVAYDLNKEVSPKLTLESDRPDFGHFEVSTIENTENHSTILNVLWKDIPPARNAETYRLNFKSCVLGSWGNSYNNCSTGSTNVTIAVKDRKAPAIDRSSWPAGELIYLGHNQTLSRTITVTDQEDRSLTPKVEIFPVEMREYVTYSGRTLRVRIDKAGVYQFNLIATSEYNMSASQSFMVEVFPENRNKTLLFADSTRDPEVVFYKNTFKNMDVMNPAIQEVNLRNISDRETLVLTTSTLLDESVSAEVLSAIEKIKHVVVATPLVEKLPETFLNRMIEKYDLSPIGRYSELPNMPPLSEMHFVTTSHFAPASGKIGLRGSASSESADPMIFNGGLYDAEKNCKGVLGLSQTGNNPYVIGVTCKRTNGGRISILGTEWADLRFSEDDSKIPVKWFDTLLNGNF